MVILINSGRIIASKRTKIVNIVQMPLVKMFVCLAAIAAGGWCAAVAVLGITVANRIIGGIGFVTLVIAAALVICL
jgi:hypothetical protein